MWLARIGMFVVFVLLFYSGVVLFEQGRWDLAVTTLLSAWAGWIVGKAGVK